MKLSVDGSWRGGWVDGCPGPGRVSCSHLQGRHSTLAAPSTAAQHSAEVYQAAAGVARGY